MTTAIYNKLLQLIPDIDAKPEYRKSSVSGFMDLNFDLLAGKGDVLTIALSHYYKHSCGDMIADPDVVMTVDLQNHLVEPVSYQDAMIYQQVYSNGQRNNALHNNLCEFISQWLSNCLEQGHTLS